MKNAPENIRHWFELARDLPESARPAWLSTQCPPQFREQVQRMLALDQFTERTWIDLTHQVMASVDADTDSALPSNWQGKRIGGYQLGACIGEGGTSAVYRGHRLGADAITDAVAIKLLPMGAHGSERQRWFDREQQALAVLSHPNITRLLDGGIDQGTPYLVLELVPGVTLLNHVQQEQLSLSQRLLLFVAICRAVAYAHRHLVVHRDLKPGNIMVTSEGVVKLLDFGIAKLLNADEPSTRASKRMLTPEYAAPEQRQGGVISTATDVYALGLILHELLVGSSFSEHAPLLPSQAKVEQDAVSKLNVLSWRAALKGDLDNIIMRAIAPEPERRYPDAQSLQDDVDRYLDGFPVRAHPPSRWYQTKKFLQRHRGAASLTAVLVLAVLVSLASALWQGHRAQLNANIARGQAQRALAVRGFLVELFETAKQQLPENVRATPDELVTIARKELRGNPALPDSIRADLYSTLAEVSIANNDYAAASALLDDAEQLPKYRSDADIDRAWHTVLRAQILYTADQPEAALKLLQPLAEPFKARTDRRAMQMLETQSAIYVGLRDLPRASASAMQMSALSIRSEPPLSAQERIGYQATLGAVYMHLREPTKGLPILQAAVDQWRKEALPADIAFAGLLNDLGVLKSQTGAADFGLAEFEQSYQLSKTILKPPHSGLISKLFNLASIYQRKGELAKAEQLMREGLSMSEALNGPTHQFTLRLNSGLATVLAAQDKSVAAMLIYQALVQQCQQPEQLHNDSCIAYLGNYSNFLRGQGRFKEALDSLALAEQIAQRLGPIGASRMGGVLLGRAAVLFDQGQFVQAARMLDSALPQLNMRDARNGFAYHFLLARTLYAQAQYPQSKGAWSAAQAILQGQSATNPKDLACNHLLKGLLDAATGAPNNIESQTFSACLKAELWSAHEWRALQKLVPAGQFPLR